MVLDLSNPVPADFYQYTDFFKPYTLLVGEWLKTMQIPGKTIQVHYGTAERIWDKIIRVRKNYSIDLPICSFNLTSWAEDEHHQQPPENLYHVGGSYVNAKPGFYYLNYDISWWIKFMREADIIKYFIESNFSPLLWLEVQNEAWKQVNGMPYWVAMDKVDFKDAYELEPGDKADRVIRLDLSIKVEAKLSYLKQGSIAKPIQVTELRFGVDENLEKKKALVKGNIQDDVYLESILDYLNEKKVF